MIGRWGRRYRWSGLIETRVVCDTDKGTIFEFGNASAPEVVEVESETALFL